MSLIEIREFSKRRVREEVSLGDEMVKIFHGGVKMEKETLKIEDEEDEEVSQEIRSRKKSLKFYWLVILSKI